MASPVPEPGTRHPEKGSRIAAAIRFIAGTLIAFIMTGVLFFFLLALWSILAGPFVRMQSASFVIVSALVAAAAITIWLYKRFTKAKRPG